FNNSGEDQVLRLFILFPVVLGNLIFSNIAYSSISICDWDQARIPSSISTEKLVPYFEKLKSECEYSQKFSELSQKLRAIGKHVEKLNYYQGLRYVDRYAYNQARKNNIPLPVVFQLKDEDYNLPIG